MTGRILSITGLTLLCLAAVSALPLVLGQQPEPRAPAPRAPGGGSPMLVVRSGKGEWFLNGKPVTATTLVRTLRSDSAEGSVRFLPSGALTMNGVSASLAWLRRNSRQPVMLELSPEPS
jgi:hypothetical protein